MTHGVCEDCKWFDTSGHSQNSPNGGFCRFNAPVLDKRSGLGRWPTVEPEDWCAGFLSDLPGPFDGSRTDDEMRNARHD